jgi:glutathione peroxidase-family protein
MYHVPCSRSRITSFVSLRRLTALHEKYGETAGLRIIGFPCNQFGGQEPGTEAEIKAFAQGYNVKWDLASKIDVNGDNAHPLWKYMKSKQGGTLGSFIKWNFTKFLIDKEGQVVARYGPPTNPNVRQIFPHKLFEAPSPYD